MKLITKYLIKEFLIVFIFSLILFCLVFLISEFFTRLSDFIKFHASLWFILKYLCIHFPLWIRDSLPISVLSGVIFSLNRFARDGEITAIKACSVNIYNFVSPLILLSIVFVFIGIILNMNIVPWVFETAKKFREIELRGEKEISKMPKFFANIVYVNPDGMQFEIRNFDFDSKEMYDVTINKFSSKYTLIEQIKAKKMVYIDSAWVLYDVYNRKYTPDGKDIVSEKKLEKYILYINDKPEDFIPITKEIDMMSISELKKNIVKERKIGGSNVAKLLVAYHLRFAYPVASSVVVFIGIPFALGLSGKYAKIRSLGYVLVISFIYWTLISVGKVLGEAQILPVILAVWMSNILFLIIGFVLFSKLSR